MSPIRRVIALLLVSLALSDAKVEFKYSTMYDIFDFQGVAEIPLRHCDLGCLIFASGLGDTAADPYLNHLLINDAVQGRQQSIAELASKFQPETSQKLPFDIKKAGKGKYSIINQNFPEFKGPDVTVWVVQRVKALESDFEIYDAARMERAPAIPNSMLTIMSASRFTVYADEGELNSYKARLVGFDNAYDNNEDNCQFVYQAPVDIKFDGFKLPVDGPIITFAFTARTKVSLRADFNYLNTRKIENSGFITSPGYHGCEKVDDDQAYRSTQLHYSDQIELHGEPDFYQVTIDSKSEIDRAIDVMANGETTKIAAGRAINQIPILKTQIVSIYYNEVTAPQSFLIKYTATLVGNEPTDPVITTAKAGNAATTVPVKTTTTSTVGAATGVAALVVVFTKVLALRDHLRNN